MPSPDDERALPQVQAEFASLNTEFPRWVCWPDGSGNWYALELGFWFADTDEVHLFRAGSLADLRAWLRGFEDHAGAWQVRRRAAGLPPADPPIPDLPLVRPSALDVPAMVAAMNEAVNVLSPGRPSTQPPAARLAMPGDRPADGCRRHRLLPVTRRTGPGRTHQELK